MNKKWINFELYKKRYIIYFAILLSIFNAWFLSVSNEHYNLFANIVISSENEMQKEYNYYESENFNYKSYLENRNENMQKNSNDSNQDYYLKNEISFNNYLLTNEIFPLNIGIDFNHIGGINGATAVYSSIKTLIPLLIPILSLIISVQCFQKDKRSFNYMHTLPIKKSSIINSKLFSIVCATLFAIIFILVMSFIRGIVIGGIGDFRYPILLNSSNINSTLCNQYLPLWVFIVLSLCLFFIQVLFYTIIGLFITKTIKNKWLKYCTVFITGIIPIIYVFVSNNPMEANYPINFLPFINDYVFDIITYGFSPVMISLYYGIMIMGIIVFYKVSLNRFEREVL